MTTFHQPPDEEVADDDAAALEDDPEVLVGGAGGERTTAGRAILTVLAALGFAALLCADSLVQVAERQPFGARRDLSLAIARPLETISHVFGLHLPRLWLAEATGNVDLPTSPAGEDVDVPSAAVPTTTAPRPANLATSSTLAPTTTTTLPLRRVPTAEDPLRVVLFGDSLMGHLALGFERLVQDDPRIHVYSEYHIATGLARPDVLDWPAYFEQILPGFNPEVIFLAFGGNDDQPMQSADGTLIPLHTPEWQAEYARRVALTMDVAAQADRTVVWIGLPAQGRDRLNQVKDVMNAVAIEQAALRPRVIYVDLGAVLTPGGVFTDQIVAPDGSTIRVRESDGVHVSIPGGVYVAPTLLAAIATEWNLVAPPAAPPTTVSPLPPAPP